jgi:hypothetical protein
VHHTRKLGRGDDGPLTSDDMRGASGIVYSARAGRLLAPMSGKEADSYGIRGEDRYRFFRVERAKVKMARRGTVYWVELVERTIANGENGSYGDTVAVCTLWTPPDAMEKVTDIVAAAIREEVGKGGRGWQGGMAARHTRADDMGGQPDWQALKLRHGR